MLRPLVALVLAAAIGLQAHLLHRHLTARTLPSRAETVWIPPAPVLQVLAFGHDHLVADALWLQVIQYYGGKLQAHDRQMPNLWPYFDGITTLDPDFDEAYFFGSYLLADDLDRPDLALTLLDRGWRHQQGGRRFKAEAWRFPYQMGFVHFFYRHNKAEASRYFQLAGTVPGAPPVCNRLAASLAESVGERDTAMRMWGLVYQTARDTYTRGRAERNLIRLKIEDDLETLRNAVDGYHTQNGNWPESLAELTHFGWLSTLPLDPYRQPYRYDPQSGVVSPASIPARG